MPIKLTRSETTAEPQDAEPRWPAFVAVLAVGGLYAALPNVLTMGPRWLFPLVVLVLLIPTVVSHHTGRHRLSTLLGFVVDAVLTAGLIISVDFPDRCSAGAQRNAPGSFVFGGIVCGLPIF